MALAHHPVGVERNRLGADRSIDQFGDLLNRGLEIAALLLRHQRGIGRHAAQDAPARRLADLGDVRSVPRLCSLQTMMSDESSRRRAVAMNGAPAAHVSDYNTMPRVIAVRFLVLSPQFSVLCFASKNA